MDCKVYPVTFAGHVKIRLLPERLMLSCGAEGLTGPNEKLNTVPIPLVPPFSVVPYKALPAKVKPAWGLAPSLLV